MRHHWLSAFSFLAAVPFAGFATLPVLWDDMRVKHTWSVVPANWEGLGHPPANSTLDLYIALKAHRESALIDALYEVSDPRHPRYGAHLSKEQVAELVRPHPDTLKLVSSWLVHHGVRPSSVSTTHGGAWLTVTDVFVSQANQLLGASYQLYRHAKTNEMTTRTVAYALPAVLHAHIQTVAPTTYFASTSARRRKSRRHSVGAAAASRELVTVLSSRYRVVTPSYLRRLYNTFAYAPAATDQNLLGVVGFRNEHPNRADLTEFMTRFLTDAQDATFTVVKVNGGGYDQRKPGVEASIDVQYAEAMAYPTPLIFYSIGGDAKVSLRGKPVPGDVYLEWFSHLLDQQKIPQTISVSYGGYERDFPTEYTKAVCDMFGQLGLRGVSVLYPSGDEGVGDGGGVDESDDDNSDDDGGGDDESGDDADGDDGNGDDGSDDDGSDDDGSDDDGSCDDGSGVVQFIPEFPASKPSWFAGPYVTSVGATAGYDPEVAAGFSGGGFSSHFPRPSYQDSAVSEFLKNLDKKHAGLYNPEGRGIPDVAAQARRFVIILNNVAHVEGGTSCSTPTVAGIISLLNDYLISKGKSPLGFLNIWLYGGGLEGLNDITSGSNPGCGTDGFSAIVGWDPVTGLGTPDFQKLQSLAIKLDKLDTSDGA